MQTELSREGRVSIFEEQLSHRRTGNVQSIEIPDSPGISHKTTGAHAARVIEMELNCSFHGAEVAQRPTESREALATIHRSVNMGLCRLAEIEISFAPAAHTTGYASFAIVAVGAERSVFCGRGL